MLEQIIEELAEYIVGNYESDLHNQELDHEQILGLIKEFIAANIV